MHQETNPKTTPRALIVAFVQVLSMSLALSLLVRAVVDDWKPLKIAVQFGLAIILIGGSVLVRARLGETWPVDGSTTARVLLAVLVIGPVVASLGVAAGFVFDATSIQALLLLTVILLVIEAIGLGMSRRGQRRGSRQT